MGTHEDVSPAVGGGVPLQCWPMWYVRYCEGISYHVRTSDVSPDRAFPTQTLCEKLASNMNQLLAWQNQNSSDKRSVDTYPTNRRFSWCFSCSLSGLLVLTGSNLISPPPLSLFYFREGWNWGGFLKCRAGQVLVVRANQPQATAVRFLSLLKQSGDCWSFDSQKHIHSPLYKPDNVCKCRVCVPWL